MRHPAYSDRQVLRDAEAYAALSTHPSWQVLQERRADRFWLIVNQLRQQPMTPENLGNIALLVGAMDTLLDEMQEAELVQTQARQIDPEAIPPDDRGGRRWSWLTWILDRMPR